MFGCLSVRNHSLCVFSDVRSFVPQVWFVPKSAQAVTMSFPSEAEALSVLAELRRTIDPETSKPFEAENSRADPAYIRAALAVQRQRQSPSSALVALFRARLVALVGPTHFQGPLAARARHLERRRLHCLWRFRCSAVTPRRRSPTASRTTPEPLACASRTRRGCTRASAGS